METTQIEASSYQHEGSAAVRHLFEVAASIDSLIMGETEILGQTRLAYSKAQEAGTVGPVLHRIFERAFHLAKEIREHGGIGQARASISSAAVKLAGKIFEDLSKNRVLVIGTGEMASGMVRTLRTAGVREIHVVSRTQERADEFARNECCQAHNYNDLERLLGTSDIVLVSTAAPHFLITKDDVKRVKRTRRGKPLFFIDISVPRNVDPDIHQLDDVYLYDMDDLESIAREGREKRERAAAIWGPRLAEEATRTLARVQSIAPDQTARQLLEKADQIRAKELENLLAGHDLDEELKNRLHGMFRGFQNKLLHGPLATLKDATRNGNGIEASDWVRRMFKLPDQQPSESNTKLPATAPKNQNTEH